MSFIEHQIHSRLMHKRNFLSVRYPSYKRTFESHAIFHHGHYSKIFSDEPVTPGEDKEIQLTVRKAPFKAMPVAAIIALVSWPGALILMATVTLHHWIWNKIHLEMPQNRSKKASAVGLHINCSRNIIGSITDTPTKISMWFSPFADFVLGTNARPTAADLVCMRRDLGLEPKEEAKEEAKELVMTALILPGSTK